MSFKKKFLDKIIFDDRESFISDIGGNCTYPIINTLEISFFFINKIKFSKSLTSKCENQYFYIFLKFYNFLIIKLYDLVFSYKLSG